MTEQTNRPDDDTEAHMPRVRVAEAETAEGADGDDDTEGHGGRIP